uniref:Uncharacterized protein n=1 Tax=Rhipicephalus zambeziensis TaxID=60191 RepID=A0A224YAG5_9ACAR
MTCTCESFDCSRNKKRGETWLCVSVLFTLYFPDKCSQPLQTLPKFLLFINSRRGSTTQIYAHYCCLPLPCQTKASPSTTGTHHWLLLAGDKHTLSYHGNATQPMATHFLANCIHNVTAP